MQLELKVETGKDDLRDRSWFDLIMHLAGRREPFEIEKVMGTKGLKPRTTKAVEIDVPVDEITDIHLFQLQHVSQEGFGQTADNWDLRRVWIRALKPTTVAHAGPWRFEGNKRILTFR